MFANEREGALDGKRLNRLLKKHGIEAVLAHVVKNKVEAAYRRTDLFERRRRLMADWEAYLHPRPSRRGASRPMLRPATVAPDVK